MRHSKYISVAGERETALYMDVQQPIKIHRIVISYSSTGSGQIGKLSFQKNTQDDIKMTDNNCLFYLYISVDANEFISYTPYKPIVISSDDTLYYVADTSDNALHMLLLHLTIFYEVI